MSIIARVQARLGQSSPVEEITSTELTGGSAISLVDLPGTPDKGWQPTGKYSADMLENILFGSGNPASEMTVIIRYNLVSYGASNDATDIAGASGDVSSDRLFLNTSGNNNQDIRTSQTTDGIVPSAVGETRTIVARNVWSGSSVLDYWFSDGGATDAPDDGRSAGTNGAALSQVFLENSSDNTIIISDIIVDNTALTNAQCRAIATDLRAIYPAGKVVIPNQKPLVGVAYELDLSQYFTDVVGATTYVASSSLNAGLAINSAEHKVSGSTTTEDVFTGTITATDSEANEFVSAEFSIIVDATAWGPTRAEIEAADQTSGAKPLLLINDFDGGDLSTDRFRIASYTQPTQGNVYIDEYSRCILDGADDDVYEFTYTAAKNNVEYGTANVGVNAGPATTPVTASYDVITNLLSPASTNKDVALNLLSEATRSANVTLAFLSAINADFDVVLDLQSDSLTPVESNKTITVALREPVSNDFNVYTDLYYPVTTNVPVTTDLLGHAQQDFNVTLTLFQQIDMDSPARSVKIQFIKSKPII